VAAQAAVAVQANASQAPVRLTGRRAKIRAVSTQ
jgi:hypothetical protein